MIRMITSATVITTEIPKMVRFHMCHSHWIFTMILCESHSYSNFFFFFLVRNLEAERLYDSRFHLKILTPFVHSLNMELLAVRTGSC